MPEQPHEKSANDLELERIVRENEAGVADVMASFELAERHYFAAATASTPQPAVIYSSNTLS